MTRLATLVLAVCALTGAARAADDVKYAIHDGHFEKNTTGLKDDASFLVFTDPESFEKIFGTVPPLMGGKKFNYLPKDAFKERTVIAVIHRGNSKWEYTPAKITNDNGVLTVHYEAKAGPATSAKFATPMILSLDKGEYKEVVFMENGKKAATVKVEKK